MLVLNAFSFGDYERGRAWMGRPKALQWGFSNVLCAVYGLLSTLSASLLTHRTGAARFGIACISGKGFIGRHNRFLACLPSIWEVVEPVLCGVITHWTSAYLSAMGC